VKPATKQKAAAEPRTVFVLRVFARPAMSRAIESTMIRETLERCRLEFGGGVGGILTGTIYGPADPFTQERPTWAAFEYLPSAPP
jgi:hypothetical protein